MGKPLACYLNGQQSVEHTEKDLLVDIHSLKEINGPLGFCQVVMDRSTLRALGKKIDTQTHTIKCHSSFTVSQIDNSYYWLCDKH